MALGYENWQHMEKDEVGLLWFFFLIFSLGFGEFEK